MINVKCFYENGDITSTGINATFKEAQNYFIGQWFNLGSVEDNMQKCERIELIKEEITINNTVIIEGEKYKHNITGVIYTVKKNCNDKLQFDNDIIHVDITTERMNQVTKI